MGKWLSDRIVEEAGRRIYESQQSRLSDQTTSAAKRAWRSDDVPEKFWDSYVEDARAALSLTSIAGARRAGRDVDELLDRGGEEKPAGYRRHRRVYGELGRRGRAEKKRSADGCPGGPSSPSSRQNKFRGLQVRHVDPARSRLARGLRAASAALRSRSREAHDGVRSADGTNRTDEARRKPKRLPAPATKQRRHHLTQSLTAL